MTDGLPWGARWGTKEENKHVLEETLLWITITVTPPTSSQMNSKWIAIETKRKYVSLKIIRPKPDKHDTYWPSVHFKLLQQVIYISARYYQNLSAAQFTQITTDKKKYYTVLYYSTFSNSHLTFPIAGSSLMILKTDCNKHFSHLSSSAFKSHLFPSAVRPLSLRIAALFSAHFCGAS